LARNRSTTASITAGVTAAVWIRQRSQQVVDQCRDAVLPYRDVGEHGLDAAVQRAGLHLMRGQPLRPPPTDR